MNCNTFDRVIIGSSPIAVMYAIQFSQKGFKTALVEKEKRLGGAWRTENLDTLGTVECACHLIEYYAGVYEKISELLDINFIYLKPQPIKVFKNGQSIPYTTRWSMLSDFLRLLSLLLGLITIRCINYALPQNIRIKKGRHRSISDLLEIIQINVRYRLLYLFDFKGLKGPEGGYAAFAEKIEKSLETHRITVLKEHVSLLEVAKTKEIKVVFESGKIALARKIFLTESIYFKNQAKTAQGCVKYFWHILVSVSNELINIKNTYIHLPENEIFHRITTSHKSHFFSTSSQRHHIFLVQTRKDPRIINNLNNKLSNIFFICGITTYEACHVEIHHIFSEGFPAYPSRHIFSKDLSDARVNIIRTFGDLGKAVIQNPEIMEV